MTDNDPRNKNNAENNETYSRDDIERSRAELIDGKIDAILALSVQTHSTSYEDENGVTTLADEVSVVPPDGYSVLRSYGYSRVVLSRERRHDKNGSPVYPALTMVDSFDNEGIQKEEFYIFLIEGDEMHINVPSEEAGARPLGVHSETGELTEDITKFDPESYDMMAPFKLRQLQGNEYASLMSIIIACETDIR